MSGSSLSCAIPAARRPTTKEMDGKERAIATSGASRLRLPHDNRPRPPLATMARRPPAPSAAAPSRPKDASGSVRKAAARRPGGQVRRLPNPSSPAQAPSMSARPVKPATSASSAATTATLGAVASGRAGRARTATNLWPSATSSPLNSSPRHELPHDGEREPTWSQCNLHGRKSRSNKL